MEIRAINESDNKALAEIIRQSFLDFNAPTKGTVFEDSSTDNLYQLFKDHHKSILWVATEKDEILGCGGIFPTKGLPETCTELVKLYLSKNARGKGIGKQILLKCIDSAKENGYENIYLESIPAFTNALKLYEMQGFEYLNAPIGHSGHHGCDKWMIKKLI